jgi:hypothetical protein
MIELINHKIKNIPLKIESYSNGEEIPRLSFIPEVIAALTGIPQYCDM